MNNNDESALKIIEACDMAYKCLESVLEIIEAENISLKNQPAIARLVGYCQGVLLGVKIRVQCQ